MNLNVLRPGNAVKSCFEKPSLVLALVLALLPSLVVLGGKAMYGVSVSETALETIVLGYVRFFALFLVILAMGLLLEFKKARSRMLGLFSSLSLLQILQLAFAIVSLIAMPLILSPETIDFALKAGQSPNSDMVFGQIQEFVALNPEAGNPAGLVALTLIGLAITVWGIYLLYKTTKAFLESKGVTAILLTVIALIIMGALTAFHI